MNLDPKSCYTALATRDARFDGVLFVGVTSTGIYCRPVCPARTPKRENCQFFQNAASAERGGFRPCLRCRPELAPGRSSVDAPGRIAARAFRRIEAGALDERRVDDLAAEFGVTARQLRRVVEREFGVSPIELAQTRRLLLAKHLLTDSSLPVIDVAFASGFASLRRFNALFRERYGLNPSELRRLRGEVSASADLLLDIGYRPPFDWGGLLRFLAVRATPGVEAVQGDRYVRTVAFGKHRGWIGVGLSPRTNALRVELAPSLVKALPPLLARVKHAFDLNAQPAAIEAHLANDERLGPIVARQPGLRIPGGFDGFETALRAVLGQQVSVRAATTLAGRVSEKFGEHIDTPHPALKRLPVTAARMAEAGASDLTDLGLTRTRADCVLSLAQAVADGAIALEPGADPTTTVAALERLPGIGPWTAQYVAMRVLGWPDAFPHSDLGLRKALGDLSPKEILLAAEPWRPWRAYAALHLWRSLETVSE